VLTLYHTSDLHDRRGIVEPLLRLRREEPGVLVDCGDSLRGSQTVFYRREPIIAEIDAAGYDVQAMGNREFNYRFAWVRARAQAMRHPFMCSNLIDVKGRDLPFLREFALEHATNGERWRLRFCALLVPQYPIGSPWERIFGWRFLDPIATAREFAARKTGDETLVVLSHLGLRADRALAAAVPNVDLILGGHSHDTTETPERVGEVPIVHAGPYGARVSRSRLAWDATQRRARIEDFQLLPLLSQ
jgi:2',3'-cyclic-nucleotide 2'-phosphodiesterase (5'-nucleotidase family)